MGFLAAVGIDKVKKSATNFGKGLVGPGLEELGIVPPGWTAGIGDVRKQKLIAPRGSYQAYNLRDEAGLTFYSIIPSPAQGGNVFTATITYKDEENEKIGTVKLDANVPTILITGVEISDSDMVNVSYGFNDFREIQVYGKEFKTINIAGEILLGTLNDIEKQQSIKVLQDWFEANRVSVLMKPITFVSIPEYRAYDFYLTKLIKGNTIQELNILPFTLQGFLGNEDEENTAKISSRVKEVTGSLGKRPSLFSRARTAITKVITNFKDIVKQIKSNIPTPP